MFFCLTIRHPHIANCLYYISITGVFGGFCSLAFIFIVSFSYTSLKWFWGRLLALKNVFDRMNMSARADDRILKIARTIADLDGAENIRLQDLAEGDSIPEQWVKYYF